MHDNWETQFHGKPVSLDLDNDFIVPDDHGADDLMLYDHRLDDKQLDDDGDHQPMSIEVSSSCYKGKAIW